MQNLVLACHFGVSRLLHFPRLQSGSRPRKHAFLVAKCVCVLFVMCCVDLVRDYVHSSRSFTICSASPAAQILPNFYFLFCYRQVQSFSTTLLAQVSQKYSHSFISLYHSHSFTQLSQLQARLQFLHHYHHLKQTKSTTTTYLQDAIFHISRRRCRTAH